MEPLIIILAFFFIYFHLGGLATTNILRLTKGNTAPVLASRCVCGQCGAPISPFDQLPILSFILCKGRCRHCQAKIPLDGLLLEWIILLGMFAATALLSFSLWGVSASFLYYEFVRALTILKLGKRDTGFAKQYLIAVLAMLPYYLITLFVGLIYRAVCG